MKRGKVYLNLPSKPSCSNGASTSLRKQGSTSFNNPRMSPPGRGRMQGPLSTHILTPTIRREELPNSDEAVGTKLIEDISFLPVRLNKQVLQPTQKFEEINIRYDLEDNERKGRLERAAPPTGEITINDTGIRTETVSLKPQPHVKPLSAENNLPIVTLNDIITQARKRDSLMFTQAIMSLPNEIFSVDDPTPIPSLQPSIPSIPIKHFQIQPEIPQESEIVQAPQLNTRLTGGRVRLNLSKPPTFSMIDEDTVRPTQPLQPRHDPIKPSVAHLETDDCDEMPPGLEETIRNLRLARGEKQEAGAILEVADPPTDQNTPLVSHRPKIPPRIIRGTPNQVEDTTPDKPNPIRKLNQPIRTTSAVTSFIEEDKAYSQPLLMRTKIKLPSQAGHKGYQEETLVQQPLGSSVQRKEAFHSKRLGSGMTQAIQEEFAPTDSKANSKPTPTTITVSRKKSSGVANSNVESDLPPLAPRRVNPLLNLAPRRAAFDHMYEDDDPVQVSHHRQRAVLEKVLGAGYEGSREGLETCDFNLNHLRSTPIQVTLQSEISDSLSEALREVRPELRRSTPVKVTLQSEITDSLSETLREARPELHRSNQLRGQTQSGFHELPTLREDLNMESRFSLQARGEIKNRYADSDLNDDSGYVPNTSKRTDRILSRPRISSLEASTDERLNEEVLMGGRRTVVPNLTNQQNFVDESHPRDTQSSRALNRSIHRRELLSEMNLTAEEPVNIEKNLPIRQGNSFTPAGEAGFTLQTTDSSRPSVDRPRLSFLPASIRLNSEMNLVTNEDYVSMQPHSFRAHNAVGGRDSGVQLRVDQEAPSTPTVFKLSQINHLTIASGEESLPGVQQLEAERRMNANAPTPTRKRLLKAAELSAGEEKEIVQLNHQVQLSHKYF